MARVLRTALPTSRHAELAFDALVGELGEDARVETSLDGKVRTLFRRLDEDPEGYVPWPLMQFSTRPQQVFDPFPDLPKVAVPRREARVPRLRGLKPGTVTLYDGPRSTAVVYRDDGLWKETIRHGPPGTLAGLLEVLASGGSAPATRIATHMAALDILRHGPGRAYLPADVPGGLAGVWGKGLRALRSALHERRLEGASGFLLADGVDGSVVAEGDPVQEACGRFLDLVRERPPRPPKSPEPPSAEALGMEPWSEEAKAYAEACRAARERPSPVWPELTIETLPWVVVPIEACPHPEHAWGVWRRLLGPCGESTFALHAFRPDGFTVVGEALVSRLDLDGLEAALDEADSGVPGPAHTEGEAWRGEADPHPCVTTRYCVLDRPGGRPIRPAFAQESRGARFSPETLLDASVLDMHVVRQRWA